MKKGRLKEENVAKISITAKRAGEEADIEEVNEVVKIREKKRRMRIN